MFRELQARPENKVCVDCSSRIPQWASCTYGTYMCLECSGIHRSLGVHISFVQSVTMDSWKNERFVSKMRAGGNAAFNDFLARQGVPAKVIKGPPGTNDPERVREKYHARACALYKDKMDAVADGRSWDEPPCAAPESVPPIHPSESGPAHPRVSLLCTQTGAVPEPGPKLGVSRLGAVKRRRRRCVRDGWWRRSLCRRVRQRRSEQDGGHGRWRRTDARQIGRG